MKKAIFFLILILILTRLSSVQKIRFARVQYDGGGDWYNDPEILSNLSDFIKKQVPIDIEIREKVVRLTDTDLPHYPFIFLTGHGNIVFTDNEVSNLRDYLLSGGFLYADDDYGMDSYFRREINKVFPEKRFVELPLNHQIFNIYYKFPSGLPKIHEHDNKRPQLFAMFDDIGRIMILYSYESNISDGWADYDTHNNPEKVREEALKFGFNIFYYLMKENL